MLNEVEIKAIKNRADWGYGLPGRFPVDGEMRVVQSDVLDLIAEVRALKAEVEQLREGRLKLIVKLPEEDKRRLLADFQRQLGIVPLRCDGEQNEPST